MIARVLEKHRWVAFLGLGMILYVALEMIFRGGVEVWAEPAVQDAISGAF